MNTENQDIVEIKKSFEETISQIKDLHAQIKADYEAGQENTKTAKAVRKDVTIMLAASAISSYCAFRTVIVAPPLCALSQIIQINELKFIES